MVELMPCPMCNGPAKMLEPFERPGYRVNCNVCHLGLWRPTDAKAIAAWNQRTPSAPSAVGEELANELGELRGEDMLTLGIWVSNNRDNLIAAIKGTA